MERKTGQKPTTKNTSGTTGKKPVKRARKSSLKKPKVYISTYKVILLCVAVIGVCMILLLITTAASKKSQKKEIETGMITERFQENQKNKETEIKSEQKKSEKPGKSEKSEKTVSVAPQKTIAPVVVEPKKIEKEAVPVQKEEQIVIDLKKDEKAAEKQVEEKVEKKVEDKAAPEVSLKKDLGLPAAVNNAQLIFVFDDGGQNLKHLEKFLKLPFPYTVAVLPQLVHSKETAQKVRASGNEVILHQPMQSINHAINPGPGAITYDMTTDQVHKLLQQNIEEIWPIAGLNNHEGSEITTDAEKIEEILKTASTYGIYYLDSRTNVETVVPEVASVMGYHYYERNIFLDNEKTRSNILAELKKGLGIANKNGVVIMIGHIWSADILPGILMEVYPELKAKGYTFSIVSESRARK